MIARSAFKSNRTDWVFGLVALALVLGAGATGYALPWDARAINGVNIASSLAGNTPLIGASVKSWLINGSAISTLTLSRFYALHVWVVPMLILLSVAARLFIFGKQDNDADRDQMSAWAKQQFGRNAIVIGVVFIGLSVFSSVYPAPFGPQAAEAATYLPRPGPQFLWLFEMQKYTDGAFAAMLAMGFPATVIGGLAMLPILLRTKVGVLRIALIAIFVIGFGTVGALTATAIYQDRSDSKISDQLAKQESDEAKFRASSFEPQVQHPDSTPKKTEPTASDTGTEVVQASFASPAAIPSTYAVNCAKCHGASGEGTSKFPELAGVTTREEDQLTPDMVLAIINDPKAVGRSSKMPAYKNKLNDDQKQELVSWIRSLSPKTEGSEDHLVQTARVEENNK
jgi:ubiquinol-cytochrome c reductase cytochrome b subunit